MKVITIAIILVLLPIGLLTGKPITHTKVCPLPVIYLHQQRAVYINNNCTINSIFSFNSLQSLQEGSTELAPITPQFKTKLNIPRANVN
ncbi:hypothetical protein ACFX5K_05270 [Rickettsiales bacterium LUAb2]